MAFDWFSGLIGYDGSGLELGQIFSLLPGGEVDWSRERWETAEGSYAASVQVSRDSATAAMRASGYLCSPVALKVSGNPTKFLQGHNVFGPSVVDAGPIIQAMVRAFPGPLRPPDADADLLPAFHRTRYDVPVHVDLGEHRLVHEWLRAAGSSTRSRHGRAVVSGSTVYWGKSSRRWSMKAYCKFCELAEHPPLGLSATVVPRSPAGSDVNADLRPLSVLYADLRSWCESHVRIELTLRRPELKDRDGLTEDIVWEFWNKLTLGVSEMEVTPDVVSSLELTMAGKLALRSWLEGRDVRFELPKATFYRYRRAILKAVGVDISLDRDAQWGELEQVGFDVEYLKGRQVSSVPAGLQHRLFKVA